METNSKSFLNVGSANFILKQLLEKQNRSVLDLDIDFLTKPDIIGALPFLPFPDKSLDVVMCFQMLEHLPFNNLGSCIKEIKRIAKEYILLSLPDRTRSKSQIAMYFIYRILKHPLYWRKYQLIPIFKEHFWEIGHSNITEDTLLCVIRKEGLEVVKHFRNPYYSYHHFFVLAVPT
jgi:ubiquinone/menaquinone biosynthesis C-methylase UbiE